jgi:thioredoxin reductase (NADPH)
MRSDAMADHEVLVLGAGVAGLATGLALAEVGREVAVLERMGPGGEAMNIGTAQPYPGGEPRVVAAELASQVMSDAMDAGVTLEFGEASSVQAATGHTITVQTSVGEASAEVLVVATGAHRPRLGLSDAGRFVGRGLSECAGCDGPLLAPGPVLVTGDGRTALREAAILQGLGIPLLLAVPSGVLDQRLARRLLDDPAVTVLRDAVLTGLSGESAVAAATLQQDDTVREFEVRGVVNAQDPVPATGLLTGLVDLADDGAVVVDATLRSSNPRIFAGGDVRRGAPGYVAAAIGDGLTAGAAIAADLAAAQLAER